MFICITIALEIFDASSNENCTFCFLNGIKFMFYWCKLFAVRILVVGLIYTIL